MLDDTHESDDNSIDFGGPPPDQRRIALLIDTATTWGAGLIEGVTDFAKSKGRRWVYSLEPRGKYDRRMLPEKWKGDGVVARITHPALAEQLIAKKLPAINVSWFTYGENLIPRCTGDETGVASIAAQYFLENGFRQFAYCASTLRPSYFDRLGAAFVEAIEQAGYHCEQFADHAKLEQLDSEQQLEELSRWLLSLPRPTALLAFDTLQGRQVTEACVQCGLAVPDDIAVLGGEHDELTSRISSPPLSGVDQSPREVGFRAAEMLDCLIEQKPLSETDVRIPPQRIITRQSTDKVAIDDDMLSQAVRFIHENYSEPFSIRDILDEIPLSRRALEIGFRRHLGRTPRDEIRRVRVRKALQLLCDTDWSVTRIANACGFDRPELLTRAFRREIKTTPSDFRKRLAQRQLHRSASHNR